MKPSTGAGPDRTLIGSAAVNCHDPNILSREAKDFDYISLKPVRGVYLDWIDGQGILDIYPMGEVATLDEVYTLKVSHSFWLMDHNSWHKHLKDISLLKRAGCTLVPELYHVAYKEWERRKGAKAIDLNQDRSEFFGSNVRRKYDHDSIHASVAFGANPLYMKILATDAEVLPSRSKFEALSHGERKMLVEEEVSVLALERELIPKEKGHFDKGDIYFAYASQLRMLITQYSKGYFPLWIVENFFEVYKPTRDYWKIFSESDRKILLP